MLVEVRLPLILNNHRKNSKNKNTILASKHFQNLCHIFQRYAKFNLIEQILKTCRTVTGTSEKNAKTFGF